MTKYGLGAPPNRTLDIRRRLRM